MKDKTNLVQTHRNSVMNLRVLSHGTMSTSEHCYTSVSCMVKEKNYVFFLHREL